MDGRQKLSARVGPLIILCACDIQRTRSAQRQQHVRVDRQIFFLAIVLAEVRAEPVGEGTIQIGARRSELEAYPLDISDEQDHVAAMSAALAAYGKRVRQAIDQSDDLTDKDTADMFTEISRAADKHLWFVESHLDRESHPPRRGKAG